jgi:hypothetical protein
MEQADVVRHTLEALDRLAIEYVVVGSFASIMYGEPRYTHDIDIVVRLSENQAVELCRQFPGPDWYVSVPAANQAVRQKHQFNVIHTLSGNKIDFMLAREDAWGREQFARKQETPVLEDRLGFTAHPEDVILGKLLYYREGGSDKHLRDIAGMLQISHELIDRERLRAWATKLKVEDVLDEVFNRVDQRNSDES